jgi:hypothetical protein
MNFVKVLVCSFFLCSLVNAADMPLDNMGLGSMQVMDDESGMSVRGHGASHFFRSSAKVSGFININAGPLQIYETKSASGKNFAIGGFYGELLYQVNNRTMFIMFNEVGFAKAR